MNELKNIRTFEKFKIGKWGKKDIKEPIGNTSRPKDTVRKIWDNLYEMPDGTYLKWNWFSRSWKILYGLADDILTKDLPDVDFDEITKDKRIVDDQYRIVHSLY